MTGNYPTRITKLTVTNFRCFKHAEVDFGNLTVLAGDSGVGKTSLVSALDFLACVARVGLDKTVAAFGGHARLAHRVGSPVTIQVAGCFTDSATATQPDTYSLSFSENSSGVLLRDEEWRYPTGEMSGGGFTAAPGSGVLDYLHLEGHTTEVRDPWMTGLRVLSQFRGTTSAEINKMADVLTDVQRITADPAAAGWAAPMETLPVAQDLYPSGPVPALHSNAGNLSAVLHALRGLHQPVAESILADLVRCYPWLRGYHSDETGGHAAIITEEADFINVPLEHASPGVVRMFALLTALHHPHPAPVTVMDNLNGLSVDETQTLVSAMKDAAKRTQIIALGSPTVFNSYAHAVDIYRIMERGHSGDITWAD